MSNITNKENKLKEQLKKLKLERRAQEQALIQSKKDEKKQRLQAEQAEQERKKILKEKIKEKNRQQQLLNQKRAREKRALKAERHAQNEAEIAKRKAEKQRLREQRHAESLIKQEKQTKVAIAKLRREVLVSFDFKAALPGLKALMEKYGEIEQARLSPIGLHIRYKTLTAAKKSQKKKTLIIKLQSKVTPAEIKHHAVYFEAPEEMGEVDQDVLSQVERAMGEYGKVVNIKKKARYIVIFFDNAESSQTLTSNEGNDVTIEFEGHTVALVAGVPPTQRKRRNAALEEKKKLRRLRKNGINSEGMQH